MSLPTIPHPLIFQCPLCKNLTRLVDFSASEDGLIVRCEICEKKFFSPSPQKQLPKQSKSIHKKEQVVSDISEQVVSDISNDEKDIKKPTNTDKKECPKCGFFADKDREDCPKCGLAFENVGVTFEPPAIKEPQTPQEELAQELWNDILLTWTEESKHEKFIQFCVINELFEFASIRYNKEKRIRDDSVAEKQLKALFKSVQQSLFLANKEKDSDKSTKYTRNILIVLVSLGLIVVFYFLMQALFNMPTMIPK